MATIRREVRITAPAATVWDIVGDPGTIHQWFPGIVDSSVERTDDGLIRTIVLGSGVPLPEEIVTIDPLLRRFQYRISGGLFRHHLGTVDVIDLHDGTSLVVYSTDAEPDVMALVIGGAAGAALGELKRQIEGRSTREEAA
jgi:carbon monoxide dehydrogenase subunit G